MAFREKIAWAALISTLVIWGAYFTLVVANGGSGHPRVSLIVAFVACVIVQAVVMAGAATLAAILAPGDAHAPADERDRAISRRATSFAYYFVLSAIFALIVLLHMGLDIVQTIFTLFAIIVVAEAIHYGAQVIGYRRGA